MAQKVQHGDVEGLVGLEDVKKVMALRGQLVAELVGLGSTMCAAMDAMPGFVPCGHAFGVVIEGLAASAASTSAEELVSVAADVRARSEHVSDHRGVPQGKAVDVMAIPDGRASEVLPLVQVAGLTALPAMQAGVMSDALDVALVRALAALGNSEQGPDEARTQAQEGMRLAGQLLG